ncbi:helix-turn-helix transcriptional regulator [Sphingobium chungbukense]|uniref:HTH luxR-type domain-containing protein n=1 Tax=Sphingobium chungbukense TaxID=56193 RepID=A0A0M3AP12_9SPHN|nr:helix-turn-helix transcriptional regulator [Sphingobium chungbukense]KKW91912.1 hypothetical protein YP76_12525 [Sphingobium chungbukense]
MTQDRAPMDRRERLALTLGAAVADRQPWTRFLRLCCDLVGLSYANLIFRRGPSRSVDAEFSAGGTVTPAMKQRYRSQFAMVDPVHYFAMEPGRVYRLPELLRTGRASDHPYYQDFLAPAGIGHMLSARIVDEEGETAWLSWCRDAGQADFQDEGVALFRSLLPHVAVALRSFVLIDRQRVQAAIARHVSTRFDMAAVALTASGKIVGVGPLAASLLTRNGGVTISQDGYLRVGDAAGQRRLSDAIALVLASGHSRALLVDLAGERIEMLLVPFGAQEGYGAARPDLVLYLRREREASGAGSDVRQSLGAMFGLTPVEADIALGLAAGRTMTAVAGDLHLSEHTVRSYSKAIYAKLGVKRQVDLVRMLLLSVAQLA